MMFNKSGFVFVLISFFASLLSQTTGCSFEIPEREPTSMQIPDDVPIGTVIGIFKRGSGTFNETAVGESFVDYLSGSIRKDAYDQIYLIVQSKANFGNILDIDGNATINPDVGVKCVDPEGQTPKIDWPIQIVDTNNQSPEFEAFDKVINVDLDTWKSGSVINTKPILVKDQDKTQEYGEIKSAGASWRDGETEIVKVQTGELSQSSPWVTPLNLYLANDKIEVRNYTIRLEALDMADNRAEVEIYVNVFRGDKNFGSSIYGSFTTSIFLAFVALWNTNWW